MATIEYAHPMHGRGSGELRHTIIQALAASTWDGRESTRTWWETIADVQVTVTEHGDTPPTALIALTSATHPAAELERLWRHVVLPALDSTVADDRSAVASGPPPIGPDRPPPDAPRPQPPNTGLAPPMPMSPPGAPSGGSRLPSFGAKAAQPQTTKGPKTTGRTSDPIDASLQAGLVPGRIAFNPPSSMALGERVPFSVRIVRNQQLDQELTAGLVRPSDVLLDSIRTAYRMRVRAQSTDGLTLLALSEETQIVATATTTEWQFAVTASRRGRETIWVSVTALLGTTADIVDAAVSLPVLHRQIDVTVGPLQRSSAFVTENWKWLVGTGFALSGAIVAWLGFLTG